jgi:hypothetical protein
LSISDSGLHALPSIFNRKSPVEIAENIGPEYTSAFQRRSSATIELDCYLQPISGHNVMDLKARHEENGVNPIGTN